MNGNYTNGRAGAIPLSALPARFALGGSMAYHGLGKLKGQGPEESGKMFEQLGISPGRTWALATGAAELFAGLSAILGFATRPAALAVLVTQAVAVAKVHAKNGYDVSRGGYEYNLALMGIALGMLIAGPGTLSLHEVAEHSVDRTARRRLLRKARPGVLSQLIRLLK